MKPIYWVAIFMVVWGTWALWHTFHEDTEKVQQEKRKEWEQRQARIRAKEDDKTPVKTKLLTDQSTYTSRGSVTSAAGRDRDCGGRGRPLERAGREAGGVRVWKSTS